MSEASALRRARIDKRKSKSPSTQAGEFVREEIDLIRQGVHGVRSTKQAIAIGLSKARRAGVKLPPPKRGKVSEATRRQAVRDDRKGRNPAAHRPSPKRSQATLRALRREGTSAVSTAALSRQALASARKKTAGERSAAARRAAQTRFAA